VFEGVPAETTGVRTAREHVVNEAAADRGRKGQRYADRLKQAVHHIRERNPDQSRDRDDDDISLQQHGETLSRGLRARRCKLSDNTHPLTSI
jgi:hypothetical protein